LNAVLLDQLPKLSPEKLPSSAAARTRLNSATFDKRVQD
jgi:hypothetical protein